VALSTSGALPENVNYAVKSSFLLGFLESVPEVSAKLKEPETKERKFEDAVKSAELVWSARYSATYGLTGRFGVTRLAV